MKMGETDKQVFKARLGGRTEDDLHWMKDLIETELQNRKFDSLKDLEFRICDACGFTWPESVYYCRCNSKKMMRREKVMVISAR